MSHESNYDEKTGWNNFKLLLLNSGLSRTGFAAFNLIIIWIMLKETGSPLISGLSDGLISLPLLFSFIVGAYLDKQKKVKHIGILAGLTRSLSLLGLVFAFLIQNVFLIVAFGLFSSFMLGFTSDVINSMRSLLTKLFLGETQYKTGSSLSNTVYSLSEAVGYSISGVLLTFGYLNSINIIFIIFILAVIPIILLKEKERIDVTDAKLNESIKQGLRFILNEKLLKEMLLLGFIVNFLFGAMALLLISLIQLKLNLSPLFVSMVFLMLIGGISAGSYFGKFIGGKLSFMIFLTMVSSSIVFMITSLLKNIYLIGILVLAGGFIIGITNVFFSYTLLKKIPRDLIARIMGAFNTFGLSATAMSGVVAGTIIQIVGVRYSLLIIGSVLLVISPLAIIFKELRKVNVPKKGK